MFDSVALNLIASFGKFENPFAMLIKFQLEAFLPLFLYTNILSSHLSYKNLIYIWIYIIIYNCGYAHASFVH